MPSSSTPHTAVRDTHIMRSTHCTKHRPHTQPRAVLHTGTHHCTGPPRQHSCIVLFSVPFPTTQHRYGLLPHVYSDFSPQPREHVRTSQTLAVVLCLPTNITACTSLTQASRHSGQPLRTHDVPSERPSPPDTLAHLELGIGPATHSRYHGHCMQPTLHSHVYLFTPHTPCTRAHMYMLSLSVPRSQP